MKSRVISSLQALASTICPEGSRSLLENLEQETKLPREEIQKKAGEILQDILHNYAAFDISTIDRFTHKILRTFAKDLGIPLNFEVELNTQLILQEAVDRVIINAGEDKTLTKVLVEFTLSKADDDKSWDISRDLFKFSTILTQENHQKFIRAFRGKSPQDFKNYGKKLREEIKATEERIIETAGSFFDLTEKKGLDRLCFKGGYLFDYFTKLAQNNYTIAFGAAWQKNIDRDKLYSAKVPGNLKAVLDHHQEQISLLFRISRKAVLRREYLKEILKNLTPLSLMSAISTEIEKIRKERALVLISDFNPTIAAEVNNQPVPFIYERLGERYRNYFIDEFQDTSEMQWNNIIPLIDHALSTGDPENQISGLTLVGDAKQSIYRFRGGKAEQFIDLCTGKNPFTVKEKIITLPNNFRSAKEIVEFNNSFFKYVSGKFKDPTYHELFLGCSQVPIKEPGGYVNISLLETENSQEEEEKFPQKVWEILKDLVQKGTSKSDVCILTRTRKESVVIAKFLSEKGISIVSSESLLVSNSPEVEFINLLLEFSLNPEDRNLKWSILNYLTRKLEVMNPFDIVVNNLPNDNNRLFDWLKPFNIDFDIKQLQVLSLYEAAEYIIRCFSLAKKPDAYLQFYLDYVFEKTSKTAIGITDFLLLWEQDKEKLSIVAPPSEDAVQIMTIHKSKGLEFPVVIYPFANTSLQDVSRQNLWLPLPEGLNDLPYSYFKASKKMMDWGETEAGAYKELLAQTEFDSINVLYVAFTRASKKLFILSCYDLKKGNEKEDRVSGLLIGYLKSRNMWGDGLSYDFGENKPVQTKTYEAGSPRRLEHFHSSPTSSQAVKIVTKSGALWGSMQEKAINKGNLVHHVLSEIAIKEDLPAALQKVTSREGLSSFQQDELKNLIVQILDHPELSPYFNSSEGVYLEKDIISPEGDIHRPDRLIFIGNDVSIIDYKTGSIQISHQQQMEKYAEIISAMGYNVNQKLIVYINNEVSISIV